MESGEWRGGRPSWDIGNTAFPAQGGHFSRSIGGAESVHEGVRCAPRRLEGEKMAPLCAEFGISRKTGYKIFDRYKDCGVAAFTDRSRRPYRQANRLPPQLGGGSVGLERGVA